MTAEEIFNKHSWEALGAISPSKFFCLAAMQEYARQVAIDVRNECASGTTFNGRVDKDGILDIDIEQFIL